MTPARKTAKRKTRPTVWQEFLGDTNLLKQNRVTGEELEILSDFSPEILGMNTLVLLVSRLRV